ncbi:MAG TPA: hypothetical protein VF584_13055 [Longimicrobium sp.]
MNPMRVSEVPSLLRCATIVGALSLLAPAASAQQQPLDDGFKGQGAALCVAAGDLLRGEPGADARISGDVLAWRQVLHVIEGTEARRQAALESARAGLASSTPRVKIVSARALWSTCANRDSQVRYMLVHGSADRLRLNLAEEPGTAMSAESVRRLNRSALCLAAAELFLRARPSQALRTAFREASPRHPDAAALRAIQERSRLEIDGVVGSAVGKELLADYARVLVHPAPENREPQSRVNFASKVLQDECQPAAGSQPAP